MKWVMGVIVSKLGPLTYRIDVNGQVWKRHVDHILRRHPDCVIPISRPLPFKFTPPVSQPREPPAMPGQPPLREPILEPIMEEIEPPVGAQRIEVQAPQLDDPEMRPASGQSRYGRKYKKPQRYGHD